MKPAGVYLVTFDNNAVNMQKEQYRILKRLISFCKINELLNRLW